MDPDIGAAAGGDRAAMERILTEHAPAIHRICRRICRDPADADDAAQEALVAVVRGLPRFDGRSSFSTWVHRVATNACLDELRRIRRRPALLDDDGWDGLDGDGVGARLHGGGAGDPEADALRSETRRTLAVALDRLPEEFRLPVVLRDVADLDYAAIAEVLGVPVGTVRSRIARGRGRLADLLGGAPDDAGGPEEAGAAAPGNRDAGRDVTPGGAP